MGKFTNFKQQHPASEELLNHNIVIEEDRTLAGELTKEKMIGPYERCRRSIFVEKKRELFIKA